ncbi:MAG: sigma 54-interacting transcriptional regulator [Nannocystaceae bacterium]
MPSPRDRFTATFSELRPREIMTRRPGRIVLRATGTDGARDVVIDGPSITIGAHDDSGIVVKDEAVSNVHCELKLSDDGIILRDLNSKNGTWIGNVRVREVCMPPGGTFMIGASAITIQAVSNVDIPVSTADHFGQLYGSGTKMGELFSKLERLATMPLDVLVIGETGTGKDLIAKGLHEHSERRNRPFVVVDCTNLNEGIAESILFGHRRGTFTGAQDDHVGLLEQGHGGTLFFDEIGELPTGLQPKLLRAFEERAIRRLGDTEYRPFDSRIIAATNRDLLRMVGEGQFREDLYFRLAQVTLKVPPLRERGRGDISLLADLFLARVAENSGRPLLFDESAYTALTNCAWPGNVRQLRNAVRYAAMWATGSNVTEDDLPPLDTSAQGDRRGTDAVRMEEVSDALRQCWSDAQKIFGKIYLDRLLESTDGNQSEAARRAGMSRSALRDLVKRTR